MSLAYRSSTVTGAILFAAALVMVPVAQTVMAEPASSDTLVTIQSDIPTAGDLALETPVISDASFTNAETSARSTVSDAEIECVAKVVHHEAGNQSRDGQLAVAHVMINRSRSQLFPSDVCGVANQPRQFFNLASYNPRRDTAMWRSAMEVATAALNGESEDTSQGAMFFHAAYARPDGFFRTRKRVVQLEDHIFYR